MLDCLKCKLQSKVVWMAAILLIANLIGLYSGVLSEQFSQIATTEVSFLALFGILNNPDDQELF